jgi:transformation/transcription domain-associated protein
MAFLFNHCPNLPLTDSLGTFVADCSTILEQDDATILSCTSIRGHAPKQAIIIKLRIACLEVLVAALSWPQFRDAENIEVINHKWESLDPRENVSQGIESLRTSDKIVDLSKRGLMLAVEYKLLEKIKLQEPLKQILVDVGLLNRLNVDHLNHLHSLLDIISDQFQMTLGEKLVEHLQAWVEYDVKVVHELSKNGVLPSWEPGTECEVAVKMLDVFHKLPSWASAFLESQVEEGKTSRPGLVVLTIGLEQGLPTLPGPAQPNKCWSPYRDPLVKFLNKYADKSINYFVKTPTRLATTDYFTMFVDIIQHNSGSILLEKLKDNTELLINILHHANESQDMVDAKDNCIELVKIVCDLCPNWLPEELFQACYALWRTQNFAARSFGNLTLIILNYIRRNHQQISVLLELPSALVGHPGSELTVLKEYLMKDFPRESSQETKKMVRA